jgi:enoyl-CoA hydratase/carnithine racemase
MRDGYSLLRVEVAAGVCRATVDHPPINLLDIPLMLELDRLGREVEGDESINVLVVDSAHPDFFIAHADVTTILALPRAPLAEPPEELGFFHALVDRFRTMPAVTIGLVEGIARGGGCELLASLDMRFAALGKAVFGQPEVLLGIIPGGSGTQRWPRLVGRSRALEVVLGGADINAEVAEQWGFVNRTLPTEELRSHVAALAGRIGLLPRTAVVEAKVAVAAAGSDPTGGLNREWQSFTRCLADDEAIARMQRFLDRGGQTPDVERQPITLEGDGWL